MDEGTPSDAELDAVASNAIRAHEAGRGCCLECRLAGVPETCAQYQWALQWQGGGGATSR